MPCATVTTTRLAAHGSALGLLAFVFACGGSGFGTDPFIGLTLVSAPSTFAPMCNGAPQTGTNYPNSKVEPFLAVDPVNPDHLVGVWQQDRWSTTGSNGLITGVSFDRGKSWARSMAHFSRCAGGNSSNGGDYERASDPWVTISRDGTAYQVSVSYNTSAQTPFKAILACRSTDGGLTWSEPTALAQDTDPDFVLDKESVTADPDDPRYVYAVWDRLTAQTNPDPTAATGPTWFARLVDGQWDTARPIYDPGTDAQTIANQIAVLNGTLINLFLLINQASSDTPDRHVAVLRSTDKGTTWTDHPIIIAQSQSIGVFDPKSRRRVRSGELIPAIAADAGSGKLYVTWQDARFSGGVREGIALSVSSDGGLTWSAPRQINQAPQAPAFTPALAVAAGGKLGVTYYDLRRDDPADQNSLSTTYWLGTSVDGGSTWQETALTGPFNLRNALIGQVYFLGDYEGLAADGDGLIPLFAASESGRPNDPSDIFVKAGG